jgi:hypothetical protein
MRRKYYISLWEAESHKKEGQSIIFEPEKGYYIEDHNPNSNDERQRQKFLHSMTKGFV